MNSTFYPVYRIYLQMLELNNELDWHMPFESFQYIYIYIYIFFFLPQICVNGHRDIPSQCVTLIIGIWITSDNFPCPHNNL